MAQRIHIIIAEPSVIIRSGMVAILRRFKTVDIDIAEITDIGSLETQICRLNPDILIINPAHLGFFSLQQIKSSTGCSTLKTIALQHNLSDNATLKYYDQTISIYDSASTINDKLLVLIQSKTNINDRLELSAREQEVVICIAKGYSTKQMAEQLCLSTHTIMAHRRNITNKLQIHSPAGLTIYAIVNKLIDITDVTTE